MIRDLQWTTLSTIATRAGSVVTLPLLTRTLGTEQFGLYKSIFVASSLFLTGALVFRTKTVLQKHIPEKKGPTGVASALSVVLLGVLLLSILGFYLSVQFSLIRAVSPEAAGFLSSRVSLFSFLLSAILLNTFAISVCKGIQDFRRFSLAVLLREGLFVLGLVYFFLAGNVSLSQVISLYALTRLFGALFIGVKHYEFVLTRPSFSALWEQLAEVALPLAPTAVLKRITGNVPDLLIISAFGIEVFGAWSVVFTFTTALQLFTRPVSQLALPKISEREAEQGDFSEPLILYYRYVTFVAVPIAIGGWLVGAELIAFAFTPGFVINQTVVGVLITAFCLQMYASISGQFFVGTGNSAYATYGEIMRTITKLSIVGLGTLVLRSLLVTAAGYLLELALLLVFVGWYQSQYIEFTRPTIMAVAKYVVSLLAMVTVVITLRLFFTGTVITPIIIIVAAGVYAGGLHTTGLLRSKEKEMLRQFLSN